MHCCNLVYFISVRFEVLRYEHQKRFEQRLKRKQYPYKSSGFSPLKLFLWECVKNKTVQNNPQHILQIKTNITKPNNCSQGSKFKEINKKYVETKFLIITKTQSQRPLYLCKFLKNKRVGSKYFLKLNSKPSPFSNLSLNYCQNISRPSYCLYQNKIYQLLLSAEFSKTLYP